MLARPSAGALPTQSINFSQHGCEPSYIVAQAQASARNVICSVPEGQCGVLGNNILGRTQDSAHLTQNCFTRTQLLSP